METFKIEIKETLSRIVEVNAISLNEAISTVEEMYKAEEIILDAADYVNTEISMIEE